METKKNPVEITKYSPVQKEKIGYKSAKKLQMKLSKFKENNCENQNKNDKRTENRKISIAVPPLQNINSEGLLPLQIANWLVYNHLNKLNCRCSLTSVQSELFMSVNPENMFSIYDVLDLLGISRDSSYYRNFISEFAMIENKGLLYSLLRHCVKQHIMKSSSDAEVQVNFVKETKTISEKLHEIDEVFKEKQKNLRENSQSQDTNKLKTKLETNEMLEIQKKIEIENIKKAEQMHYQNELEHIKSRLQIEFETRFQLLKEQHLQHQMEIQKKRETEQFEIRQLKEELLQELEKLQKYEETMNKTLEEKKNKLDIEEQLLLEKKKDLKIKEYEIEKQLMQITPQKNEKTDIIENSRILDVERKYQELKELEIKIHNDREKLKEEKQQINNRISEFEELKPKFYDLELSLKAMQEKYYVILKQNHLLSEKIESMADYSTVKSELSYTKKELQTVKKHFIEALNETRQDLFNTHNSNFQQWWKEQKNFQPSSDKNIYFENVWKEQQSLFEKQLENLHHKFINRNDQQLKEIHGLKNVVKDLQTQIMQNMKKTDSIAQMQSSETLTIPKQLEMFTVPSWKKSDNIDQQISSSQRSHHPLKLHYSSPYRLRKTHTFDKEKSFKFISEARKRIDYLQLEAEALEKKYGEHLKSNANLYSTLPSSLGSLFNTEYLSFPNIYRLNSSYSYTGKYDNFKIKYFTQNQSPFLHDNSYKFVPKVSSPAKTNFEYHLKSPFTLNSSFSKIQISENKVESEENKNNQIYDDNQKNAKKTSEVTINELQTIKDDGKNKIAQYKNFLEEQELLLKTGSSKTKIFENSLEEQELLIENKTEPCKESEELESLIETKDESKKSDKDISLATNTKSSNKQLKISKSHEISSDINLNLQKSKSLSVSSEKSMEDHFSQEKSNRMDLSEQKVSFFPPNMVDLDAEWKERKKVSSDEEIREISHGSNVSLNEQKEISNLTDVQKDEQFKTDSDKIQIKVSSLQQPAENNDSVKSLHLDTDQEKNLDTLENIPVEELKSDEKEEREIMHDTDEIENREKISENSEIIQNSSGKISEDLDIPTENSALNISIGNSEKAADNDDDSFW